MKTVQAFCEIKFTDNIKFSKITDELIEIEGKLKNYYTSERLEISKNAFIMENQSIGRACIFESNRIVILAEAAIEFEDFASYLNDVVNAILEADIIQNFVRMGIRYVLGKEEESPEIASYKVADALIKKQSIENEFEDIVNCGIKFTTLINNHYVNISVSPGTEGTVEISLADGNTKNLKKHIIAFDVDSYIQVNVTSERMRNLVNVLLEEKEMLVQKFNAIMGE